MAKSLKDAYRRRYGIKQPLRGYQLQAAALGCKIPNYPLLMAPRLGKTRIDIAATGRRFLQQEVSKWVIICPSIAKEVWASEIRQTLDVPHEVTIVEGKAAERQLLIKGWKEEPGVLSILIMNHEATWRLKKVLYKSNPHKITVDESHRIKNHATKQSKTLHVLSKRATYRCILTGTFLSTPTDAFSQFKFLDPSIFGERWKQSRFGGPTGFLERYAAAFGFGGHKPIRFKNLDELHSKVASVSYQLTREEAGGFPLEQYQDIHFSLTNPALNHYQKMTKHLITEVRASWGDEKVVSEIVLTQVLRLQQIAGGFLPASSDEGTELVPLGRDRIQALQELVSEYPIAEPLVIFCRFTFELQEIKKLMLKMGRSVQELKGGVVGALGNQAIDNFQSGKASTMVAQIRAGGIAIDLSRASTGIFYSMTQSFIDYEQAKARIISRRGGSVSLIHLVAKDTVDEDILASVREKADLAKLVLSRIGEKDES